MNLKKKTAMTARRVPHCYRLVYLFLQLVSMITPISSYNNRFSSTRPLRITEKETIVSPGDVFELGFFKPATRFQETERWYLGIWYKRFARRVLWVANRDNPLSNSMGTLKVANSNIILLDQSGGVAWTTNQTNNLINNQPLVAELLDNGNFVLRYSNNNYSVGFLWQSFDFPTDTLLPGMKLGWDSRTDINRRLRSWKSLDDPSNGDYMYRIEIQKKLPESFIFRNNSPIYRSGPWNKFSLSGSSTATQVSPYARINLIETEEEVTYSFDITNNSFYSVLVMSYDGSLQRWVWTPTEQKWKLPYKLPVDQCDNYRECGPNSYCDMTTKPICNCFQGFRPRDQDAWEFGDLTGGCVRKSQLSCVEDGFLELAKMKLPDIKKIIVDVKLIGLKKCRERCLADCNCTAFANTDMQYGGSGCVMWTGDLVDLRKYSIEGQDLFVKLVDHGEKRKINKKTATKKNKKIINKKTIIGSTVGGCALLLLSFIMFWFWMRRKKRAKAIAATNVVSSQERNQELTINTTEDWGSKFMEFDVIATATDNFCELNKLGKGGFGIVYKGKLRDGQEIAVKRLSRMSRSGLEGFTNEAKLIAVIQHVNLVRLIGFCSNADEKILVYEFLENSSLDLYLFDTTTRGHVLSWEKRFDITNGIVRGLIYLHQDSRFRIIHLDLKPSNILLDKDMIPKISDFGMARILGGDETEAHVTTVAGTLGYIAPEYRNGGVFSVKTDVFSFGVLLLEIISGKRNIDFLNLNDGSTLLSYIWSHWSKGKGIEIVDPAIKDSSSQQVLRCIQIGLVCVQEVPEDRPTMSSVGLMLGRETEAIPQPKSPVEIGSSSRGKRDSQSGTVPEMTMLIECR